MDITIRTSELKEILDKHFSGNQNNYTINYSEPIELWMARWNLREDDRKQFKSEQEMTERYPQNHVTIRL